jgi:hypothetical protein
MEIIRPVLPSGRSGMVVVCGLAPAASSGYAPARDNPPAVVVRNLLRVKSEFIVRFLPIVNVFLVLSVRSKAAVRTYSTVRGLNAKGQKTPIARIEILNIFTTYRAFVTRHPGKIRKFSRGIRGKTE